MFILCRRVIWTRYKNRKKATTNKNCISSQFKVTAMEFIQKDGENMGEKVIINEKEDIQFYGMFESAKFAFKTDFQPQDNTAFMILIGSGHLREPHKMKFTYHLNKE